MKEAIGNFSREAPSPRYLEMQAMHQQMHEEGDVINAISSEKTFDGKSLVPHVELIGDGIRNSQSRSLLDYGCGKAGAYKRAEWHTPEGKTLEGLKEIWGLEEIKAIRPRLCSVSRLSY